MIKRSISILILFYIFSSPLAAKTNISCRYLSISDGLSQNSVFSVFQDSRGFLWFGTEDGLNRYDGYNFEVFRYNPNERFSLSHGTIGAIHEFKDHLWIATESGLNKFDPRTGRVVQLPYFSEHPISHRIMDLCSDTKDNLWIATRGGGLIRFNVRNNRCQYYNKSDITKSRISDNTVFALLKDRQKNLWVGTESGLHKYNYDEDQFIRFSKGKNGAPSVVMDIYEDSTGSLWLGTDGEGLIHFDKKEAFTRYEPSDINFYNKTRRIRKIIEDNYGDLWLITPGHGFFIVDIDSCTFSNYNSNSGNINAWIDSYNLSILKDTSGNIWMGTWSKGVCKFKASHFYHYLSGEKKRYGSDTNDIFAICEERDQELWVGGYSQGLKKLDLRNGESIYTDPQFKNENIYAIRKDTIETDILWIGTWSNGLIKYNVENKLKKYYKFDLNNPSSISSDIIRCIFSDRSNRLWVGTEEGLNLYDRETGNFRRFIHIEEEPGSLSSNSVVTITEDRQGGIWVGTEKGLNKMISENGAFIRFMSDPDDMNSLGSNYITSIVEDHTGVLWIGTAGGGLNKFNPRNGTVKRYLTDSGLPSNTILGLLKDNLGRLWLSSNNGLIRFNIEDEKIEVFREQNGLQSNEFNLGACVKIRNGELIFGGINGVTVFNPLKIEQSSFQPPLYLKSITVHPRGSKLDIEHSVRNEIKLNHHDKILTVDFCSLDYSAPKQNRYAYMINGIHEEWIDLGHGRTLMITNLKAGQYTLKLRGSNSDGRWTNNIISLKIHVSPPFWRTWWFLSAFSLLIIFLILIWHKDRMKKQEARLRQEAHADEFCRKYKVTPREREIIELVLEGKTNDEMEDILFISSGTVKNHIYNIFQKLNVKNRTQMAGLLSDWKKTKKETVR